MESSTSFVPNQYQPPEFKPRKPVFKGNHKPFGYLLVLMGLLIVGVGIGGLFQRFKHQPKPTPETQVLAETDSQQTLELKLVPFTNNSEYISYATAHGSAFSQTNLELTDLFSSNVQRSTDSEKSENISFSKTTTPLQTINNIAVISVTPPKLKSTVPLVGDLNPAATLPPLIQQPYTALVDITNQLHPQLLHTLGVGGKTYLIQQSLIVVEDTKISGFNLDTIQSQVPKWSKQLAAGIKVRDAWVGDKTLSLWLEKSLDSRQTCPISVANDGISVECNHIYHSNQSSPIDTLSIVVILDPVTGNPISNMGAVGLKNKVSISIIHGKVLIMQPIYSDLIEVFSHFLKSDEIKGLTSDQINQLESIFNSDSNNYTKALQLKDWLNQTNYDRVKFDQALGSYISRQSTNLWQTLISGFDANGLNLKFNTSLTGQLVTGVGILPLESSILIATKVDKPDQSLSDVYLSELKDDGKLGQQRQISLESLLIKGLSWQDRHWWIQSDDTNTPVKLVTINPGLSDLVLAPLPQSGFELHLINFDADKLVTLGNDQSNSSLKTWQLLPTDLIPVSTQELPYKWNQWNLPRASWYQTPDFLLLSLNKTCPVLKFINTQARVISNISCQSDDSWLGLTDAWYQISGEKLTVYSLPNWRKTREMVISRD